MAEAPYTLTVDLDGPGALRLTLEGPGGPFTLSVPFGGHVDNVLLTSVDKLVREHRIHKSALASVRAGAGVDKNSSLYRMVKSFAAAIAAGA